MKKVNNIQDNNTLRFKSITPESKTINDLRVEGLREELTTKVVKPNYKESEVFKYVSDDISPIVENKKEKKFLNNLHFYEGESAVVRGRACVPFTEFIDCLKNLGWGYSNFQSVYKGNKEYIRYTLEPSYTAKKSATEEEVKKALYDLYNGNIDFGRVIYKYAPELNYFTVIIPEECSDENLEENVCSKKKKLSENILYKNTRHFHNKEVKKFCEDNLPRGEEMFYIVRNDYGGYLVNEGDNNRPVYYFEKVDVEKAEAFDTEEEAEEAIDFYCFDLYMGWEDDVDTESIVHDEEGSHLSWDTLIGEIDNFKNSCRILPVTSRKIKEYMKKLDKERQRESSVEERKNNIAFYVITDNSGNYVGKDENNKYFLINNIDDAETYDTEEEAKSAIKDFLSSLGSEGVDEDFRVISVFINDIYVKLDR